jgi:hypothetical protein
MGYARQSIVRDHPVGHESMTLAKRLSIDPVADAGE